MTGSIETIRTMCPMNCHPTLCGMLVDVRDGELLAVRGDKDNPDSQGFLCVRGQASRQIIGNPKRLLKPLIRSRRIQDSWREANWNEAHGQSDARPLRQPLRLPVLGSGDDLLRSRAASALASPAPSRSTPRKTWGRIPS